MSPELRFDAYAPTLRGIELDEVIHALEHEMGVGARDGGQRRRYGQVVDLRIGADLVAWCGQDHANGTVYLEAKGDTTPEVVEVVRRYWPKHAVARSDVCADFDGEGVFDYLQEVARSAKPSSVWAGYVALSDKPEDGRTWAMGRRGGVAYARLYEAGKQPEKAHWCRPNAVRFEVESRPHYAAQKVAACTMSPAQVLGLTPWSWKVAQALLQREIERFTPEVRISTHERTTLYLARAFRRHLSEMVADLGDWECVGREFEEVWKEDDDLAAKVAQMRRAS
jgi:hypothetical protein